MTAREIIKFPSPYGDIFLKSESFPLTIVKYKFPSPYGDIFLKYMTG